MYYLSKLIHSTKIIKKCNLTFYYNLILPEFRMKKILLLFIVVSIFISASCNSKDPAPPIWSSSFFVAYDETFLINNHYYTFNGQFFYDAINKRQRADKQTGRYDPTCASILPNITTKCQHLVVNEKRYIVFPEKSKCCFCCDALHGCGIMRQDWFKDGVYMGQEKIVDTIYDKWSKPDIPDALYWVTSDQNQTPRRFSEDNNTHIIDYLTHTFVNKTIDESVFKLPAYCNSTCPETSVCAKFRDRKINLERE